VVSITLTLTDLCSQPTLSLPTSPALADQSYTVSDSSQPTYTHPDFVVSPTICVVTYTYTISDLSNAESAITRSGQTFTFAYNKVLDYANESQTVTIKASSITVYPTQNSPTELTGSFDLTFKESCIDEDFVTLTPKTPPTTIFTDDYSGTTLTYIYVPYEVSPSYCAVTVECASVVGSDNVASTYLGCPALTNNQLVLSFDSADYKAESPLVPDTYTFTYYVFTGPTSSDSDLLEEFSFTVTLTDPCLAASLTVIEPTYAN